MNQQELIRLASQVVSHLRANGFEQDAFELESLARIASSDVSDIQNARQAIRDRCHTKWLGDVPIKELPLNEWFRLLDDLDSVCR